MRNFQCGGYLACLERHAQGMAPSGAFQCDDCARRLEVGPDPSRRELQGCAKPVAFLWRPKLYEKYLRDVARFEAVAKIKGDYNGGRKT